MKIRGYSFNFTLFSVKFRVTKTNNPFMIVVYHNPGSGKTRERLEILETEKADSKAIKYAEEKLSAEKLQKIINILGIKPIEIIKKHQSLWKDNFEALKISDQDLIKLIIEYPKLIEEPIIINGKKATIGKPPKRIIDL